MPDRKYPGTKKERYRKELTLINTEKQKALRLKQLEKKLFMEIAQNFNVKPTQTEAKPWMLELAWLTSTLGTAFTGKKMGVDKISAQAASRIKDHDNSKVKTALGFAFKSLQQSIREICAVMK